MPAAALQTVVADLAQTIFCELPPALHSVLQHHPTSATERLYLQCHLSAHTLGAPDALASSLVASIDVTDCLAAQATLAPAFNGEATFSQPPKQPVSAGPRKRKHHAVGDLVPNETYRSTVARCNPVAEKLTPMPPKTRTTVAKRPHPSPATKLIQGVWRTLFSDAKVDLGDSLRQDLLDTDDTPELKLLTHAEASSDEVVRQEITLTRHEFAHVNRVAHRLCQQSQVCRVVEIIVQARWVQCFDDRVRELAANDSIDIAKKEAMAEACVAFNWTEKELRNKTSVWRGYHEVAQHGGFVVLVFAGPGLYRFCKYRAGFDEHSLSMLRDCRHRFEVAADTIHPGWRQVLGLIGLSQQHLYTGHPHDWVMREKGDQPVSLASTYSRWTSHFTYTHINESVIDKQAWAGCDPRATSLTTTEGMYLCATCHQPQVDNVIGNQCACHPTLFGHLRSRPTPVQICQTSTGKNNGLFACLPFEQGEAVGEFVGQITSGVSGLDVMFGQTEQHSYQIWQGKMGNFTRFVNHSCKPNSQFEHFNWRGSQHILLVSLGIQAGQEITVDYSDTYWDVSTVLHLQETLSNSYKGLDKRCLCGEDECKHKRS